VADIGHSYTAWDSHVAWSQRLQDEFFMQGRRELELGREPGMLKHPSKPGVANPSNQIGFSDVIAMPLVKAWAEVFPASGAIFIAQGKSNRSRWLQMKEAPPNTKNIPEVSVDVI
jgi:hypothetical protein